MAIELIAKIKPKNNGSFAMVDAQDVEFEDGRRLDAVINSIGYTDADFTPVFENLTPTFTEGEDAYGEPSGKYASVLDDVTLVVDAVYKVVWDGKERICKCFSETEGSGLVINMPMLGNADIAFPGAYGNGEEFFFMTYTSVEDGNQKTSIITTDKGETHTISLYIFEKASELPKVTEEDNDKVLKVVGGQWQAATGGGGTSNEVDVIPLQELPATEYNETYGCFGTQIMPAPSALAIGETYIVRWDEDVYVCEGQDASALMTGVVAIGNCASFGLQGNNEPFIIGVPADASGAIFFSTVDAESKVYKVRVYRIAEPLPSTTAADNGKFLRVVDGKPVWVALTDVSQEGA